MSGLELNFTPNYDEAFGFLKHLNSEELKELLNNEDKLHNMIKDLQQVKNIETERELLIASNKSLSEFNLSQKPILDDTRKQLEELYNMASELKKELLEKKSRLEQVKVFETPDSILALLQAATAETEEEAEKYVNEFLDGETPIKTFLEEYLEKRKLAHLRRAKSEKMAVLLQKPQSNRSPPTRPPRPSRQKPPAPPTPAVGVSGFRNMSIPPLPVDAAGPPFIATGMLPYPGHVGPNFWSQHPTPSVVPTRPAPHPPLGNKAFQSQNKSHLSSTTCDVSSSAYIASCSQSVISLNASKTTPYPVYPAPMPFAQQFPQSK